MNKENSVAKQLEVKSNVLSQEAVHQKDIRKKKVQSNKFQFLLDANLKLFELANFIYV